MFLLKRRKRECLADGGVFRMMNRYLSIMGPISIMTLEEKLLGDYMQAFKEKNAERKGILNYVVAQIKNKKIELKTDLSDDEVIGMIRKEIKARQEAIGFLEKAGKSDEIPAEQNNIAILEEYIPQMMGEDALRALVEEKKQQLNITDIKAGRGQLVGAIMAEHKSVVDGKMLNEIIVSMM